MSKRVNVKRLLRKHRSECWQRLDGISMYEDRPYDHNTEQIIKACKDDIRLIDTIFFVLDEKKFNLCKICGGETVSIKDCNCI